MNEIVSNELDELMLMHQDNCLNEAQRSRLNEILTDYPEAREQFAEQQLIDAALYLEQSRGLSAEGSNLEQIQQPERFSLVSTWIGLVAAFAIALGLGLGFGTTLIKPTSGISEDSAEAMDNSVAILQQVSNVEWLEAQSLLAGAALVPGKLSLSKGLIQIEFYSGSRIIVEGPAEIELLASNEAICHYGKIRAFVPEHARGFTIRSKKFQLVDLGTEFGMEVQRDGAGELQIFDGEVELYQSGQDTKEPSHRLLGGNGLAWTTSGEASEIAMNPDTFTSFSELHSLSVSEKKNRLNRWQNQSRQIIADPRVIAYYNFESKSADSILKDLGPGGMNGTIVGCEWTEGRFEGKSALEFKRLGDRVRLDLPDKYRQVTIASWLRVDALPGRTQAILTSDGFEKGEAHWQLSSEGQLALGVRTASSERTQADYDSDSIFDQQSIGKWAMICTVYDLDAKSVNHYLNGQLINQNNINLLQPLTFGSTEIGNWRQDQYRKTTGHLIRNFNGRIDELVLWNAALSHEEIEQFYSNSRP